MSRTAAPAYAILAVLLNACPDNSSPDSGATAVSDSGVHPDASFVPDATEPPDIGPPPPPEVAARPPAEPVFGDVNGDGTIDVADAVAFQNYKFRAGPAPVCAEAADFDNDGLLEADDTYRISTYLVTGNQRSRNLGAGACAAAEPWPTGQALPIAFEVQAPLRVTRSPFSAKVAIRSPQAGVQGWSMSILPVDCRITAATTAGTLAAEVWDEPPGLRHLGYSGTFAIDGGALTYVIMSQIEDVTLPVSSDPSPILSLEIEAAIPPSGCAPCTLFVGGGLRWRGQIIEAVIAAGGYAYVPELPVASIEVCAD